MVLSSTDWNLDRLHSRLIRLAEVNINCCSGTTIKESHRPMNHLFDLVGYALACAVVVNCFPVFNALNNGNSSKLEQWCMSENQLSS